MITSSVLIYFIPFIFAFLGWLIAKLAVHIYISALLKRKLAISQAIGTYAEKQFSLDAIEQKLVAPETIEKIIPFADAHIEEFLRVKLPAAMPMLAMFISDKLVADMKTIFMNELKQLFPALIQQYLTNVKKDISISNLITTKINGVSTKVISNFLWKQFRLVEASSSLTGFLCGILYIFLTRVA